MDTKKSIDWKKKIPRIIQPNGTVVYDCDIFGGNNVNFRAIKCLNITGNLAVGDNFVSGNISLGGSGFFGDSAYVCNIGAEGNVAFGDNAHTDDIYVGGNVFFGNNANIGDINTDSCVCLGDFACVDNITACENVYFLNYAHARYVFALGSVSFDVGAIVACENISFGDNATVNHIEVHGNVSFGNNSRTGIITAGGKTSFGNSSN